MRPRRGLENKAVELMLAAPQVIAHRSARLWAAGAKPSQRDRREFTRMTTEKVAAANEAWRDMGLQLLVQQQRVAWSMVQSWWQLWAAMFFGAGAMPARSGRGAGHWQRAANSVLAAGLAPVHRRAVANARRLDRARR